MRLNRQVFLLEIEGQRFTAYINWRIFAVAANATAGYTRRSSEFAATLLRACCQLEGVG